MSNKLLIHPNTPKEVPCSNCGKIYSGDKRKGLLRIGLEDSKEPLFIPEDDKILYHVKADSDEIRKQRIKEFDEELNLRQEMIGIRKDALNEIKFNFAVKCQGVGLAFCDCNSYYFIIGIFKESRKKYVSIFGGFDRLIL